jgi:hypothetical protein
MKGKENQGHGEREEVEVVAKESRGREENET